MQRQRNTIPSSTHQVQRNNQQRRQQTRRQRLTSHKGHDPQTNSLQHQSTTNIPNTQRPYRHHRLRILSHVQPILRLHPATTTSSQVQRKQQQTTNQHNHTNNIRLQRHNQLSNQQQRTRLIERRLPLRHFKQHTINNRHNNTTSRVLRTSQSTRQHTKTCTQSRNIDFTKCDSRGSRVRIRFH